MAEPYINRARDVEALVKEHGFERGIYRAVMKLSEDNVIMRQELAEQRKVVEKMADIVANIATVGAALKNEFANIQRKFYPDNESNPNQPWNKKQ